ncbi:DNA N-6-adenine-methyltransferase [Hoeflea poritis]|uniref:DNA N-6-adenine-methyltransferase n=1 Tax=Hoeflea poritis TaxID=2993659 RepID=A0ABT4VPB4_9HYPH|nr:DNA N-6-adenine-methyltransferase [Hoeflea poritis]MDA4845985.1 DNA N-6-adenine-methyltransferase [Hoeflea poritis]
MTAMTGHQSSRPRTENWLTPPYVLEAVGGPGSFDLDPCSPVDRPWPTARQHYTIVDNGLHKPWHGRVWLNPPYRRDKIGAWLARMTGHGVGLALIFARTETEAFQRYVWDQCDALFFLEGRLTFHLGDGRLSQKNAGAPSVLCAYGTDDADVLAHIPLEGRFVPLTARIFMIALPDPGTWAEEVTAALDRLGRTATLDALYRELAASPKSARNRNYKAKIRQVLQRGLFERVDRGIWRLL